MKPTYLLSIILLLITIAGCSDNSGSSGFYGKAVQFSVVNGVVMPDNKEWATNDAIGMYMYQTGTAIIENQAENREYIASEGGVLVPATLGEIIYYPSNGTLVDFVSYYPYRKDAQGSTTSIDLSDQSSQKDIDLLYSNNVKGNSVKDGVVNLEYTHQLSKLILQIRAGNGLETGNLQGMKVVLEGTNTTANFSLSDASIGLEGNNQAIEMNTKTNGTGSVAIILPSQTSVATSRKVVFTVNNIGTFTWNIPQSTIFESGKRYTYNVTVNKTNLDVSYANVEPWITEDPIVEGGTSVEYKVGDYYPDPNIALTAEGIVFLIRPGSFNRHGQILSLKKSEPLAWGTMAGGEVTAAQHRGKGVQNQDRIRVYNPTFDRFPAFKWVEDLGEGWFLPARFELYSLYIAWNDDRDNFNIRIVAATGNPILEDDKYWTSTEYATGAASKTNAEYFNFSNIQYPNTTKTTLYPVRGIKSF